MDADLRRAERAGDWRGLATALRRAGRLPEARRVLSGAVKVDPEAWSLLDAWFPLSDAERGLLASLTRPLGDRYEQRRARYEAAVSLVAFGDPRFDAALADFDDSDTAWVPNLNNLNAVLAQPLVDRLIAAAELLGPGVLVRVEPTVDEVNALLERFGTCPDRVTVPTAGWEGFTIDQRIMPHDHQGGSELLALSVIHLAGAFGDERSLNWLEQRWEAPDSRRSAIVREELWSALHRRGRLAESSRRRLDQGARFRPAWVEGRPFVLRDPLTLAINRRPALERCGLGAGGGPGRLLLIDLDNMKRFNDRHGHLAGDHLLREVTWRLQEVFGDRVARYAGDEWLVPWEGEDLESVAQEARAFVAALPSSPATGDCHGELCVSISGGIGRTLRQADEAIGQAKRGGRDRVETWRG